MHSLRKLGRDTRGVTFVEYLAIAGAVAIGLAALAASIRDDVAAAFIERSGDVLGVE